MKTKLEKLLDRHPVAVLISDVHYNINTLEVADRALRRAIDHANELSVRVIVCGDLHDTKANLRGECTTAMMDAFSNAIYAPAILVGNHDKINEKSQNNSLSFLRGMAHIVNHPKNLFVLSDIELIPYQSDKFYLLGHLSNISKENLIIMHQGVTGTEAGHYMQDKTAITKQDLAGRRIISGHYHRRQTLELPEGGQLDYVGNPYTLGFSEANDPEKGYQILYSDDSLEFVPTNLRKHVVIERTAHEVIVKTDLKVRQEDILWLKISGPSDHLATLSKKQIKENCGLKQDFKLDLIPTDTQATIEVNSMPQDQMLDTLIESLPETDSNRKARLKLLWKQLHEGDK